MKRLILSAAAIAILGGPAVAQPQDQGQDQHHHQEHPQGSAPARTYTPPAPRGPAQGSAPAYRAPPTNFSGPHNYAPQTNSPGPRNYAPQNQAPTGGYQHYNSGQNYRTPGSPTGQYGGYRGYQGGQYTPTRPNTGQYQGGQYQGSRQYQGGQYQGSRQYQGYGQYQGGRTWNRNGGRLSGDWWRGRQGFERYEGHRRGFWFAPGWGYYQVNPRWYGYDWEIGGIVPYELRSYYVSDPYDYGLPPAPYGAAWVFLGDQIVLIDLQSGEIIQIAGSY
jgi:Ni/Co efflux regulator RcnB